MSKHMVLPDVQAKPGGDFTYLKYAGEYMVAKKPDVVICIGDFADMPSLSSYDVGKKSFEGRRYTNDIKAAQEAMTAFLTPMKEFNERARKNKEKQYKPRMVLTLGNHEDRINRAINNDSKLAGLISIDDLLYKEFGWEVYNFLVPVTIDGICYSHFFSSGILGRPVTSARMLLTKKHMSCVAGHQQGRDIAYATRADGQQMLGLIAGSFYEHDEEYLNPQTNNHWRGFYVLHDINDGACDEMAVSIKYLKERYGSKPTDMEILGESLASDAG
jgi:hypothetical protein